MVHFEIMKIKSMANWYIFVYRGWRFGVEYSASSKSIVIKKWDEIDVTKWAALEGRKRVR